MRSLTNSLTAAQKLMKKPIAKIVLGSNEYTYGFYTTNVLLGVTHNEQPYSQQAQVKIDDYNKVLTGLSLEGKAGVLSYGYTTSAGDEYSATAPLKVKSQEVLSTGTKSGGILACQLNLYGLPDQLAEDEASTKYSVPDTDTKTVKTLISAICANTLTDGTHTPYSHCTAVTVTYDSEDSLIDTFIPRDYFTVYIGESRLEKIKELLSYTKCVMRFGDDGALHILNPTVSGTSYDYEYNNEWDADNHTFFSKVYRTRLVIPNKVTVSSEPEHFPSYSGSATSAASYALLPKEKFITRRLSSDAQGTAIATAMIQRAEMEHETGNGHAPMNVGQEVYDYVKLTDIRADNSRVGNIGWLTRYYQPKRFDFTFGFGDILLGSAIGLEGLPGMVSSNADIWAQLLRLATLLNQTNALAVNTKKAHDELMKYLIPGNDVSFYKLKALEKMIIPSWET